MEDHRFDDLVRSLASTSRRRAVRLLVAGVIGAFASPNAEAAAACVRLGLRCGPGKRCCAGTACRNGRCRCKAGVPCAGRCCAAGQRCANGRCAAACPPPTCVHKDCGLKRNDCGQEIDCEACGYPNTQCSQEGRCVCVAPTQECGGFCLDTATDSANCGECDRKCPKYHQCVEGVCSSRHCPSVPDCSATPSAACDEFGTGSCLCMRKVDGGTHCGYRDYSGPRVPCATNEDCRPEYGDQVACVDHPDSCGQGAICVVTCAEVRPI